MTTPAAPASPRSGASGEAPSVSGGAADALAWTIGPTSADVFFEQHWEHHPLVVAREEPRRFEPLLSPADVEEIVCTTGIRTPAFRLVRDGAQIALREYTEDIPWRPGAFTGTAVVSRVAEEFARGATLVLQGLHLTSLRVATYCRDLEARLGCPVQANAYHTPASSQGFGVHHDTHDVFVVQVAGRKRWLVYAPVLELPLKTQKWSPRLGDPGAPVADLTLHAGDTLYLPRGWPHEAATSDAESLHLTIGLHPTTRIDALRAALDACADDVEFRRNLAADGTLPPDLLDRLAERLRPDDVARRARRRLAANRRPILDGQLEQVRALGSLTPNAPLERRPTVLAELAADGAGVSLVFDGKELRFPAVARAAVEAVHAVQGSFTAAELPGPLDPDGRLVLVRRLIREGFLRRTDLG